MISIKHETDLERLRQIALLQETEIGHLHRRIKVLLTELAKTTGRDESRLQLELKLLQEQLDRRINDLYGRSSEKRPMDGETEKPKDAEKKPKTGHGPREQINLPVVEKLHELDEADKACPKCGGALNELVGQTEDSEEIDIVHRSYRVVKHRRKKYVCKCGECVETAIGPQKLIAGGRYSVEFGVDVAVSKYADHLPLSRQVKHMARHGLGVNAQTLWDQLWAMHGHLKATYEALHGYVLSSPVVGADETTWGFLKKAESKDWYAWSVTRHDAVFYKIMEARSAKAAGVLLKDYGGVVMADGYSAYGALARELAEPSRAGPRFTLANCWAHGRRKFVECEAHYPVAKEAIEIIRTLYDVERRAKDATEGMAEAARLEVLARMRREESAEIVEKFYEWVGKQTALPKSGLGIALEYMVKYRGGLEKFLKNPRIPLDNNHTEREMRPVAVGRKNHYGSKSLRGTQVAAMFYSLIESAKLAGLNPVEYLGTAVRRAIDNPGTVTLPSDLAKELAAAQA